MDIPAPRYLVGGRLTRDYIIFPNGSALLDVPGGNVLYASVGLAIWESNPPPGLLARVGSDYPVEWIDKFTRLGLNMQGVRVLPDPVDSRSFVAFTDLRTRLTDDPVAHFARHGLAFPRSLLGYPINRDQLDSRMQLKPTSLRQGDIPAAFLEANVAHLCPLDYLSHSILPATLRQRGFTTITLDPAAGYMNPIFFDDVPGLLTDLTAFLPSEEEIRALFQGRTTDLWEMAEALAAYGTEIIVIKRGESGQWLYNAANRTRWDIPPYPARLVNPIGAGDAFCGGFVAGYRRTFDPLQAVLYGNISASLVVEGNDPAYSLDALPGLPEARLEAHKHSIRQV